MSLAARALGICLVFLTPSVALADVISMEQAVCRDAKENDACDLGDKKGFCVKSTCSKNDYGDGAPPKAVSVDCLVCDPEAKAPEPEETKVEAEAEAEADAATKEEPKKDGEEAKPAAEAEKGGMCSVDAPAPLGLGALALGLALWVRRRN